jgi:hypothetical protein
MPFYCGKRSADICVVLGQKTSSTYSLGKERVLARLGWAGVIATPPGFFELAASHPSASPFPRNEGLLGQSLRSSTDHLQCFSANHRHPPLSVLNLIASEEHREPFNLTALFHGYNPVIFKYSFVRPFDSNGKSAVLKS